MAMKFGRSATDKLFRECLKPAVAQTGFELRRLDENPKAGLIDLRMEVLIRTYGAITLFTRELSK